MISKTSSTRPSSFELMVIRDSWESDYNQTLYRSRKSSKRDLNTVERKISARRRELTTSPLVSTLLSNPDVFLPTLLPSTFERRLPFNPTAYQSATGINTDLKISRSRIFVQPSPTPFTHVPSFPVRG